MTMEEGGSLSRLKLRLVDISGKAVQRVQRNRFTGTIRLMKHSTAPMVADRTNQYCRESSRFRPPSHRAPE